jgi:hypothetical protein
LPGDVKPVQVRHLEIQQNQVRRTLFYSLQRFSSGPRLCANLPSALLLKQSPQIVPDCRVVVYHENSNQSALPGAQGSKERFRFVTLKIRF